jgi:hypothetical protein
VDSATIPNVWDFGWSGGSIATAARDTVAARQTSLAPHHLGGTVRLTLGDGRSQSFTTVTSWAHQGNVKAQRTPSLTGPADR